MACSKRRQSSRCCIAMAVGIGGEVEATKMSLPRPSPGRGFKNAMERASPGGQTPRPLSELWGPRTAGRLSCVVGLALLFRPICRPTLAPKLHLYLSFSCACVPRPLWSRRAIFMSWFEI
ncbi:hypothetical protein MTO96_026866 [Rhipicephalus appendiculatus]